MKKNIFLFLGLILIGFNTIAQETLWTSARPDGHAPINVMGDHSHKKGEWMFSYRFMNMSMDGNLKSSDDINNQEGFINYMVLPQKMTMNMHMLGAMYAPSDKLTIMLMTNMLTNSMDLKMRNGNEFTTESNGFGDVSISGLVKILNKKRQSLHANIGISIPTGDIDQRDDTPMMSDAPLAYPMQLGSGTWDPILGFTYLGQSDKFSWGLQSKLKFRAGENEETYKLGNEFNTNVWGAIKVSNSISFSGKVNYKNLGEISGSDPDLNPMMMPLFSNKNSGKNQLDLAIGSNYYVFKGSLKNLRIGAEVGFPVSQNVNGIQMKQKLMGTLGLQYSFGGSHSEEE